MKKHRLFVKGETVYALISSSTYPNILIPVKAIIKDVEFNVVNPRYLIKIVKFFDNIHFLKKYLFNIGINRNFQNKTRKFPIKKNQVNNRKELYKLLSGDEEYKYYIAVDSIMTVKYEGELINIFNKIQTHLLERKFRDIRDMMTRVPYTGIYKLTGYAEFEVKFKKFIGDRIKAKNISTEKFFRLL